eukprot:TRINITY_DN1358_c0_g1_i1.p1 TRINITY_DN1358_c0_g1~~TRINITY_DN1358_c0_g1_i1.p1  ORF type:complete len:658 (-),score=111.17 TRINITY_DN1358_c0_g1_i1:45-2018(-)
MKAIATVLLLGLALADPVQRAREIVARMTLDEKMLMVHGSPGAYTGNVPAIPRLGIPPIRMNDGPQGFRGEAGKSTQYPCGLALATTFDVATIRRWGATMAKEFRAKGANVLLGPGVNIARVPQNGRNFEYSSGEDPYLGYHMIYNAVRGIQSVGMVATTKHYINNNQETNRYTISADLDERTEMEIYHPPFQGAIDAQTWAIMCSYNKINGFWACENNRTLNTQLKSWSGFPGWVMSDWGATHSTVLAANSGLDQQMPDDSFFGSKLKNAVLSGQVSNSTLDDKVVRILAGLIGANVFDDPPQGDPSVNTTSAEAVALCREIAAKSAVLLKNDGLLPLNTSLRSVAVIGKPAKTPVSGGGGSGSVVPSYQSSILVALQDRLPGAQIVYNEGSDAKAAAAAAASADIAIVVDATDSCEGSDRTTLALPNADLISAVGKAQPLTIAVAIAPGAILTDWSADVAAALVSFLPGQEEGNGIVDVLFGDGNHSGRLPLSFPNTNNDVGFTKQNWPGVNLHSIYSEKLNVGYRWYTAHGVKPAFPFGHGLTYTTFAYSDLDTSLPETIKATIKNTGARAGTEVAQLYVRFPASAGEPPLQLKGFVPVTLSPGDSSTVTFRLSPGDLSIWDTASHTYVTQHGTFSVFVGASSADIRLTGQFAF